MRARVSRAPPRRGGQSTGRYATCTALSPFRRRRAAPASLRQRLTGYTRCRERLAPRTPPSYSSPSHSSVCAAPVSTLSVTAAARTCRRTRLTPPGYMPCALPPGRSARTTRLPPPGGRTCALGALGTLGACLPAELRHGPGLGEHVPAAPAELLHVRERPRSGLGEPASVKQACRIRFWRRCSPVGCVKIQISFEFFKKKLFFLKKKRPLSKVDRDK